MLGTVKPGARVATQKAGDHILNRAPFTTSGAMFGTFDPRGAGQLPFKYHSELFGLAPYDQRPIYYVYSYGTPIAWYTDDGTEWTIPDVEYSATTSKHQGVVRHAIAHLYPGWRS